jgi:hypothetical protein
LLISTDDDNPFYIVSLGIYAIIMNR